MPSFTDYEDYCESRIVPEDLEELLTTWVERKFSISGLPHCIRPLNDAGIHTTKELLAIPKGERATRFKRIGLSDADRTALTALYSHTDGAKRNSEGQLVLASLPASPSQAIAGIVTDPNGPSEEVSRTSPLKGVANSLKPKEKRYNGLYNQGATCYLNSLLQALFHLSEFRRAVYWIPTDDADSSAATSPMGNKKNGTEGNDASQAPTTTTGTSAGAKSIPLALQRLFYDLENTTTGSVSTKALTASFGWTQEDSFIQHDIQELLRKLSDKLALKMKSTKVEGTIERLFCGRMVSYVKCIGIDHVSVRDEEFYDLQLTVRGCKDVYASFDEYTVVETLNDRNKYAVDRGNGKVEYVDAEKGVWFRKLPPVLMVHLRRFEYNVQTDRMAKVHDYYEFFEEIDLQNYMVPDDPIFKKPPAAVPSPVEPKSVDPSSPTGSSHSSVQCTADVTSEANSDACSDRAHTNTNNHNHTTNPRHETATSSNADVSLGAKSDPSCDASSDAFSSATAKNEDTQYVLYGVLVHSGGSTGGHYYAYLRPDNGTKWLMFNDTVVHEVNRREAMQANFGQKAGSGTVHHSTTAYMLIYLRKCELRKMVFEVHGDMRPAHLRERIDRERAQAEALRKRREEMKRHVKVHIWCSDDVHQKLQVNPLTIWDTTECKRSVEFSKDAPLTELKNAIVKELGIPVNQQRLWLAHSTSFQQPTMAYLDTRKPDTKLREVFQLSKIDEKIDLVFIYVQKYNEPPPNDDEVDEDGLPTSIMGAPPFARDGLDQDPEQTVERKTFMGIPLYVPYFGNSSRVQLGMLLFVCTYYPATQSVAYHGAHTVLPSTPVARLMQIVRPNIPVLYDNELMLQVVDTWDFTVHNIEERATFSQTKIFSGQVVWIQPVLPPQEINQLELPTVDSYLRFIKNRREVLFIRYDHASTYWKSRRATSPGTGGNTNNSTATPAPSSSETSKPKGEEAPNNGPSSQDAGHKVSPTSSLSTAEVLNLTMSLQSSDPYSAIQRKLAQAIGVTAPSSHIRLWGHNEAYLGPERNPLSSCNSWKSEKTLSSMIMSNANSNNSNSGNGGGGNGQSQPIVLYWEVLTMPVSEAESSFYLEVEGFGPRLLPLGLKTVAVRTDAAFEGLLVRLAETFGTQLNAAAAAVAAMGPPSSILLSTSATPPALLPAHTATATSPATSVNEPSPMSPTNDSTAPSPGATAAAASFGSSTAVASSSSAASSSSSVSGTTSTPTSPSARASKVPEMWLVALNPTFTEISTTFANDCSGDRFAPAAATLHQVNEQIYKDHQLRYVPKPIVRKTAVGSDLPNQKWIQVLHFEALSEIVPFRGNAASGILSARLKMHSDPFFIYMCPSDTGETIYELIAESWNTASVLSHSSSTLSTTSSSSSSSSVTASKTVVSNPQSPCNPPAPATSPLTVDPTHPCPSPSAQPSSPSQLSPAAAEPPPPPSSSSDPPPVVATADSSVTPTSPLIGSASDPLNATESAPLSPTAITVAIEKKPLTFIELLDEKLPLYALEHDHEHYWKMKRIRPSDVAAVVLREIKSEQRRPCLGIQHPPPTQEQLVRQRKGASLDMHTRGGHRAHRGGGELMIHN